MTSGHRGSKVAPFSVGGTDPVVGRRGSVSGSAALPAPAIPLGFRAQLNGASLWDLVQMECLGRSRRVVQVSGEGGVGYLYFSGGRVIHAVTSRSSGEGAALEILSWTNGSFQPCERSWPAAATIDIPHEALILQAAKRRDEAAANLVAFRGRTEPELRTHATTETYEIEFQEGEVQEVQEVEDPMAEMRNPNINTINQAPTGVSIARGEPLPDFSVMIRVGANGAIIKNKGGSEELAGVVAYTQRLIELVGDLLGMDKFVAMECTFKNFEGQDGERGSGRCLLFTEANGDVVALRPRIESNIQPLRDSLGL